MEGFEILDVNGNTHSSSVYDMADAVHHMCVLVDGLAKPKADDDLLDGIGIGICTALAILGDCTGGFPIRTEDEKMVKRMINVGAGVLSAFDDDKEEEKEEEPEKEDEEERVLAEDGVKALVDILEKIFGDISKIQGSSEGKHD